MKEARHKDHMLYDSTYEPSRTSKSIVRKQISARVWGEIGMQSDHLMNIDFLLEYEKVQELDSGDR